MTNTLQPENVRKLGAIAEAASAWGVSKYTAQRLIDEGFVKSVTIGARRLVPLEEIERVAREGAGKPRRRKTVRKHPIERE